MNERTALTVITPPAEARYGRIIGVGAYRPERVVDNEEICQQIDSSDEWIQERSGIRTRHFAAPGETVVDMSEVAARQALEHAGLTGADIDTVIVATVTHMLQTPAAAPLLAERLGATPAAAFDISAACAGFCHGVTIANDLVRGGSARNVLLIGAEKLSGVTNFTDRGTAFIFGDGAGAVVISGSATPGIGPTLWGSDGAKAETIIQRPSWDEMEQRRDDPEQRWPTLSMDGQPVFRWAVFSMAPVARQAVEAASLTLDELDAFVPHQANMRIIDAMVKQLKLDPSVPVARDIAETGNTSAASVPIALRRMIDDGVVRSGDRALLIGFGAGLVYAAQVVEIP